MNLVNLTRRSRSIPIRLLREGKLHLLPIYALLWTSTLGREGIERSGSFAFADHLYRRQPSGRFGIGIVIDVLLLRLPAARSFFNRFQFVKEQLMAEIDAGGRPLTVVSVPCGIPRDLAGVAEQVAARGKERPRALQLQGVDIDPAAVEAAAEFLRQREVTTIALHVGDAFDPSFVPGSADVICCTGLTEFLEDGDVARLFSLFWKRLSPGGLLISSATVSSRLARYLMEELAELRAHYRQEGDIIRIISETPFENVELRRDAAGYQILFTARKSL